MSSHYVIQKVMVKIGKKYVPTPLERIECTDNYQGEFPTLCACDSLRDLLIAEKRRKIGGTLYDENTTGYDWMKHNFRKIVIKIMYPKLYRRMYKLCVRRTRVNYVKKTLNRRRNLLVKIG